MWEQKGYVTYRRCRPTRTGTCSGRPENDTVQAKRQVASVLAYDRLTVKRPSKTRGAVIRDKQNQAQNGHATKAKSGYICGAAAARGTIGVGDPRALRCEVRTPKQGGRGAAADRRGVFRGVSERASAEIDLIEHRHRAEGVCVVCGVWCGCVCGGRGGCQCRPLSGPLPSLRLFGTRMSAFWVEQGKWSGKRSSSRGEAIPEVDGAALLRAAVAQEMPHGYRAVRQEQRPRASSNMRSPCLSCHLPSFQPRHNGR